MGCSGSKGAVATPAPAMAQGAPGTAAGVVATRAGSMSGGKEQFVIGKLSLGASEVMARASDGKARVVVCSVSVGGRMLTPKEVLRHPLAMSSMRSANTWEEELSFGLDSTLDPVVALVLVDGKNAVLASGDLPMAVAVKNGGWKAPLIGAGKEEWLSLALRVEP